MDAFAGAYSAIIFKKKMLIELYSPYILSQAMSKAQLLNVEKKNQILLLKNTLDLSICGSGAGHWNGTAWYNCGNEEINGIIRMTTWLSHWNIETSAQDRSNELRAHSLSLSGVA